MFNILGDAEWTCPNHFMCRHVLDSAYSQTTTAISNRERTRGCRCFMAFGMCGLLATCAFSMSLGSPSGVWCPRWFTRRLHWFPVPRPTPTGSGTTLRGKTTSPIAQGHSAGWTWYFRSPLISTHGPNKPRKTQNVQSSILSVSIRYRDMDACQNAVKAGQCLTCTLLTDAVEMSKEGMSVGPGGQPGG